MKTTANGTIQISTIISVNPKRSPKMHKACLEKPEGIKWSTYICFLCENGIPDSGVVLPKEQEEDLTGLAEEL